MFVIKGNNFFYIYFSQIWILELDVMLQFLVILITTNTHNFTSHNIYVINYINMRASHVLQCQLVHTHDM